MKNRMPRKKKKKLTQMINLLLFGWDALIVGKPGKSKRRRNLLYRELYEFSLFYKSKSDNYGERQ